MAVPGARSVIGAGLPAAGRMDRIRQMLRETNRAAAEGGQMVPRPTLEAMPSPLTPSYGVTLDPDPVEIPAAPAPTPAAVAPPAADVPPRVPYDMGGGRFADESGAAAQRLDGQRFVFEDGTVVDVEGNVLGTMTPGDLTDTAAPGVDNLENSGVELDETPAGGAENLKPNAKREDKLDKLAGMVMGYTGPDDGSAVNQGSVRRLLRDIGKLSEEEQALLARKISPAPEEAQRRLGLLAEMGGEDPAYRAARQIDEAAKARQSATIPQGARSVEVSPVIRDEFDMPQAPEGADAAAALREREAQVATWAPGGGNATLVPMDARIRMFGFDPNDQQAARQLPLFLKGSEGRNDPLETRAMHRDGMATTRDEAANTAALGLKAEIDAAQEELKLAKIAASRGGSADAVAAVQDKLRALYAREDELFPPRLINQNTGEVQRAPAAMLRDSSLVPPGYVVERGRPAAADSWLNRAGQADTYDSLVVTATGYRPRAANNIARAGDDLTAGERARIRDQAIGEFGEDAAELMGGEFDPDWSVDQRDLSEPSAPLKEGRLGGRPQMSREQAAIRLLVGERNPFELELDGDRPFKEGKDVAREILARNRTFTNANKADYDMALERLAALVEREYPRPGGPEAPGVRLVEFDPEVRVLPNTGTEAAPANDPARPGVGTTQDVGRVPAQQGSWPEGTMRQGATVGPNPQQNTAGTPPAPPVRTDFSKPETALSPEDRALAASAVELDDPEVIDAPDDKGAGRRRSRGARSAGGEVVGDEFTPDQIRDAWKAWFESHTPTGTEMNGRTMYEMGHLPGQTFEQWEAAMFGPGSTLRNRVPDGSGVRTVRVIGVDGGEVVDAADDAGAAARQTAGAGDPPAGRTGADDAEIIDAPDDPATPARQAGDAETTAASSGGDGTPPPRGPDGTEPPTPKPKTEPKKSRIPWKTALVGGSALAALYNLAQNATKPDVSGPIDVGGGGSGEGGQTPYIPVGIDASPAGMAGRAVSDEDAISSALERIRGSRKSNAMPSYNTMFNYTYRS